MANGISRFNLPTDLNVSGGVGVTVTGSVYVQNSVSASYFSGSGAAITNITASHIDNFTADVRSKLVAGDGIVYDSQTGAISASFSNFQLTGGLTDGSYQNIIITDGTTPHPTASLASNISLTSVTASFSGSGAGLHSIPADAISGLKLDSITVGNVTASVSASNELNGTAFSIVKNGNALISITNSGSIFTKGNAVTWEDPETGNKYTGSLAFAHGIGSQAVGDGSFALGNGVRAFGSGSHAEGFGPEANGDYSHAEGWNTKANGISSHAEGEETTAVADYSHAEGINTHASGVYSHAEGWNTYAYGEASHAEGNGTEASGSYSHAQGIGTIASGSGQAVLGKYNKHGNSDSLVIIGNGTDNANRSDLFIVNIDGIIVSGTVQSTGGFTGSLSGTSSYALNADKLDNYQASAFARLSASNIFSGSQTITGNLDISGRLTALEYYTQYVSSSIIYTSGSTQFGNSNDDLHSFSGSIFVSGGIHTQADVTVQGALISDATIVELSGSENAAILQYSTDYVSAKLIITGESVEENNNNQTMEMLVLRNGSSPTPDVTWVPYAILHTSQSPVFTVSAGSNGGLITISALNLTNETIKIRTQKIYSLNAAG
jgi:hypothetical protein